MDLSGKDELRWLSAVLADVNGAAPDIDFLVVGAIARDLVLHHGYGVPVSRATTDVDLGVTVAGWQEYARLRDAFLEAGNFQSGRPKSHRFVHRSGVPVDLVPYGGVERDDGTIVWPEDDSVMGVLGYKEAYLSSVQIDLPDDTSVATVSLPMLAVLKLLAWSERHQYVPRKDASDLVLILANYLNDENVERVYEVGAHLLENKDFDYEAAGAWLVGYDAADSILEHSIEPGRVFEALERILETEKDANGDLRLVADAGGSAEQTLRLLAGFLDGLNYLRQR